MAEVQKHGVLPVMLSLIRLCHDGMTVCGEGTTADISIRNG